MQLRKEYTLKRAEDIDSQFPLWDFFECNEILSGEEIDGIIDLISQFPLWDFFECN
jgi:hypothetical protein